MPMNTRKLNEFYSGYEIEEVRKNGTNAMYVDSAFTRVSVQGITMIEMTEMEYECFLQANKNNIVQGTDVAGGGFTFWGVHIIKEK